MSVVFRPGTLADTRVVYDLFQESLLDLGRRLGVMALTGGDDPAGLARDWDERRPLFEHLAQTAEHFWLAETDGQAIGYARTILRSGVRELTEFFVRPGQQSAGVGRALLERVYPADGAARHRVIIATTDERAQARYLKLGVYPRFPIYYFSRTPEAVSVAADLQGEPVTASPETLALLRELDEAVLGHGRDADHAWLLANRQGYVYRRGGRPAGYGYLGYRNGPFALLEARDFPAVLAHAEAEAARAGWASFGIEVPMVNRAAVEHLLARGFRFDAFFALFMSDVPLGRFENYICTSPPFFL